MSTAPQKKYAVLVDDNFHYQDASERYELGKFDNLELAVAACRVVVEEFLASTHEAGMSSADLYGHYVSFGEDPFIVGADGVPFSAWDYAKQRCEEICQGPIE